MGCCILAYFDSRCAVGLSELSVIRQTTLHVCVVSGIHKTPVAWVGNDVCVVLVCVCVVGEVNGGTYVYLKLEMILITQWGGGALT